MQEESLKNMVILKNLPSNLVEEAIIVLKSSKKAKKLIKVEEHKKEKKLPQKGIEKDYIVKEAEILVSEYLAKIENHNKQLKNRHLSNKKYNRLKIYSYFASLIIVLETIVLLISY